MNSKAIIAVFKRNLASYFGSPSGYVFILAFLVASGAARSARTTSSVPISQTSSVEQMAPIILLGFIPAITMSVWADERRQERTNSCSLCRVVLGRGLKYLGW